MKKEAGEIYYSFGWKGKRWKYRGKMTIPTFIAESLQYIWERWLIRLPWFTYTKKTLTEEK